MISLNGIKVGIVFYRVCNQLFRMFRYSTFLSLAGKRINGNKLVVRLFLQLRCLLLHTFNKTFSNFNDEIVTPTLIAEQHIGPLLVLFRFFFQIFCNFSRPSLLRISYSHVPTAIMFFGDRFIDITNKKL